MIHNDVRACHDHIRACWEYVLGYGYHKDSYVYRIMESIKHVLPVSSDYARECLQQVSSEVYWVSDYTDGDEVGYAKELFTECIGRADLPCLSSKYRHEVSTGEWYYADKTLNEILKKY